MKVLDCHKKKNLSNLDIHGVIKIADMITSLRSEVERIDFEIFNCNNDILLKEKDYHNRLINFLESLRNSSCDKMNISDYDEGFVDVYRKYQIVHLLDKLFKGKSRNEIIGILSNDRIKLALGKNYDLMYERYIDDVGADS